MKACGLITLVTVILGTGASPLQQIIEDPQAEKYWEAASCVYLDQWFTCDKGLVSIDNGVITCVDGLTVSWRGCANVLSPTHRQHQYFSLQYPISHYVVAVHHP